MANEDIRYAAKRKRVKLWEVAERMGMRDNYLSVKLRHELASQEKEKIFSIIDQLAEEAR